MTMPFNPGAIPVVSSRQYAAPDISKLLYEGIGNLPQDYYQGQQLAQQSALSKMFPQGLTPYLNPDGTIDPQKYAAIANQAAKIGGYNVGMPMLNNLIRMQIAGQNAQRFQNDPDSGVNQPPAYSPPQTASPASNTKTGTPGPQSAVAPAPSGQPPEPTGGMDNIAGIGTEHYGQNTEAKDAINFVSRALKVDPDQTLSQAQISRAHQLFNGLNPDGTLKSASARADTDQASGPQPTFGQSEDVANVPRATSAQERGVNGSPGPAPEAPVGGAGRGPVSPIGIPQNRVASQSFTPEGRIRITPASTPPQQGIPQGVPPPPQMAQAVPGAPPQGVPQPAPQQGFPQGATPLQPPPGYGQARIDALGRAARDLYAQAARMGGIPGSTKEDQEQANILKARADKYLEERQKLIDSNLERSMPTGPQKEAMAPGSPQAISALKGSTKQSEIAGEAYAKQYASIKEMAQKSATERPKLALAKHWLSDPSMYTGPWASHVMRARQILANLGGNPNAAQSQEAFNKAIQDLTLNIIQTLPPPVRVREMAIIQQAQAQSGITIPTNRLLVEMADRAYARGDDMYKIASKYGPAGMGPAYDREEMQYWAQNPLFTKDELRDPRRIAPPVTATPQDRKRLGIPDGSPSMTPDGRIITHGPQ